MSTVRRYDAGELKPAEKTPEGFLIVEGLIARTGVQVYRRGDGSEVREYRPPEEVFDAAAVASFDLRPVTNTHPPELLTAKTAKQFTVGAVGGPRQDGSWIKARLAIHDAAAIDALLAGRAQLSCGYDCEVEVKPGTSPSGERYDAVQRRIRGNHVALVDAARAGPSARVRLDAADASAIPEAPTTPSVVNPPKEPAMQIRIDGIALDATDANAPAIQKHVDRIAEARADADKAKAEADKARDAALAKADAEKARADAAEKQAAAEKARADAAGAAIPAAVAARVALEVAARKHLGAEAKLDGKSDLEVRKLVIAKLAPEAKLDDKSEAYILARYDAELERVPAPVDAARATLATPAGGEQRADAASARAKMIEFHTMGGLAAASQGAAK